VARTRVKRKSNGQFAKGTAKPRKKSTARRKKR
jgi:hypothetical protein